MTIAISRILLALAVILVITLFTGVHAADDNIPENLLQTNQDKASLDSEHYMSKRRFLPSRRELNEYMNDEDPIHLTAKRYFLKSKRYFLNSKRQNEQEK